MALKKTHLKVILFDLDGTLLVYTESSEASWQQACHRYEADLDCMPLEHIVKAIVDQAGWFWSDPARHKVGRLDLRQTRRSIAATALESLGIQNRLLAEKVADAMSDHREKAMALAPGAIETLACLRERGFRLGMITNGDSNGQRYKIRTFGLEPFFEAIQIEQEAGIGKPEDGVYEMALERFEIDARQAWMIGDDLVWDIQAAQKEGVRAGWVDYERKGLPKGTTIRPDRVIHSLDELIR